MNVYEGFYFEFVNGKWSSCSQMNCSSRTPTLKLAQNQPASNEKHGMADRQDNEVN